MKTTALLAFGAACCLPAQPAGTAGEVLSVDQVVREAIEHNLDLAAGRYNISLAETRQITARLRPNPVMTVSAQQLDILGTHYNPSNPSGPNQFTYHTDYVIERGGKRADRIAVAESGRTLAELGVKEMMRQLIFSVQSAFVDMQLAKDNLRLARENLASLQEVVRINEAKERGGDLAKVELERSRIAAIQYEAAVEQSQLQLEQAKLKLGLLLGRSSGIGDVDIVGPYRRDPITDDEENLRRLAFARRPDILSAQTEQARSRADLRLQLAYGKVDWTVGSEFTRQWASWGTGNSVGFTFSMPIPIYNRNQGEIARAERQIDQSAANFRAIEVRVATEIETAYRQYTISRRMLEKLEQATLERARGVRDTTEYSYKRGEASLVEFLDAQRAFNDTMQTYNLARADYARSLFLMDSITGATVEG